MFSMPEEESVSSSWTRCHDTSTFHLSEPHGGEAGPLIESSAGNRWVLTMIDCFTRWPVAIPIPNRESKLIGECIYKEWICHKGIPTNIISDQGRELVSKSITAMCQKFGIQKIQTSGYSASVERFHRYFLASLSILFNRTGCEWDECVSSVLFA